MEELKDKLKYLITEIEKKLEDQKRLLDNIKKYKK